jgi:mannose/fructose/N-acetylgalactosamine-specific phosphotransferase system component IID
MIPRRTDFTAAFLRSFAVQGSWNYRTMIGGGLGYALTPLLRRIHAGDPVALRQAIERHAGSFNAHPYLSPVAIGALARLEHEGRDAETCDRFRTALRGPLGALGDQAVWAGWRPFCALVTILAVLSGADARLAVMAFFIIYNAGHVGLRFWGFRMGWHAGLDVGGALNRSPLRALGGRLMPVNQALTGAVVVMLVARAPGFEPGAWEAGLVAVAALGAFILPSRGGVLAMGLLFAATAAWFF